MTNEELSRELSLIGNIEGWKKMVIYVQRLILAARLDEAKNLLGVYDSYTLDRIKNLTAQLEELK